MDLNFLTDDWKKIPQTTKYFFIFGIFLIFTTWLVDHWGENRVYLLLGWDFRNTFFNAGVIIIILSFLPLLGAQFLYWHRAKKYKLKYPTKELNNIFYLIWFKGKLYLFDKEMKKYFHVTPWATAQDLFFTDLGTRVDYDMENKPNSIEIDEYNQIVFSEYKNGGVITTRLK